MYVVSHRPPRILPGDLRIEGMARYREPDAEQTQIVVLNFAELFPDTHFVPRLLRLIRSLDLSAFDSGYGNDHTGRPAVPPDSENERLAGSLTFEGALSAYAGH